MFGFLGGIGYAELLILLTCGMGCPLMILWVWALVDCVVNEPSAGNEKIVWVIIIVFTHWIGALLYLLLRRPKRKAEVGR